MKRWTEEGVNYLKENYTKLTISDISTYTNRTEKAVYTKAKTLGLESNYIWKTHETNYLIDSWGYVSVDTIAKNLNRTKLAITQKAEKLKLGPFLQSGDYVTLQQLFKALRNYKGGTYTIKQWMDKGIPVKKKKVRNCGFQIVYLEDFWDWAERNRTIINFSKLEPNILGKEPKWVKEQRKADQEKNVQFKNNKWTKEEEQTLIVLLESYKYTYRELSLRLRRTETAIKRRVRDLGIKARPLRMPNHNPWTEEETEKLKELYHKGYTSHSMANYINRSAQACSGKIERLIKDGELFPRSEFRTSC